MEVYRGNMMSITYDNKVIDYYKMFLFICIGIIILIAIMNKNVIIEQLKLMNSNNTNIQTQMKENKKDKNEDVNMNHDHDNNQIKLLYNKLNNKKEKNNDDKKHDEIKDKTQLQMVNAYRGIPYREKLISDAQNGYCFIGSENGYRSCIHVNINDRCMSNEIYPSKRICQHPELRE